MPEIKINLESLMADLDPIKCPDAYGIPNTSICAYCDDGHVESCAECWAIALRGIIKPELLATEDDEEVQA